MEVINNFIATVYKRVDIDENSGDTVHLGVVGTGVGKDGKLADRG